MSGSVIDAIEFAARRAERILEHQRAQPQYHERVARVREYLERQHVSPDIIERVFRLNPRLVEGEKLRGIHFTSLRDGEPTWAGGCIRKGRFLQMFGAAAWRRLPRSAIIKRGRRQYVTREHTVDMLGKIAKAPGAA